MKSFKASKTVFTIVAAALITLSALLIVVASNTADVSDGIIEFKVLIWVVIAFSMVSAGVWILVKAYSDSKKACGIFCGSCAAIGLASEFFGIYSDKISTGVFGILGALLLIIALSFGIAVAYRSKNKRVCACIEAIAIIISLAFTVGAILLLGKEHISNEAWVLLLMAVFFLGFSIVTAVKRHAGDRWQKALKTFAIVLLAAALLSYGVAFSVALTCTNNYIIALKLPGALVVSALVDGDVLVHTDFTGEKAYISVKELSEEHKHSSKLWDRYFCDLNNFCEFPLEKAMRD